MSVAHVLEQRRLELPERDVGIHGRNEVRISEWHEIKIRPIGEVAGRQSTLGDPNEAITRENAVVAAQVAENSKDQALKGNLPGAVQQAVVRAMTSNTSLATLLLKEDRQGIGMLTSMIYDMMKTGDMIDLDDLRAR